MVWEKPSQKNGKRKTSRIATSDCVGLVGSFSIIILILLFASALSMVAQAQPPGRLVDVDGIRMHIYCTGEGSPTVVLDAGLNGGTMSGLESKSKFQTIHGFAVMTEQA